MKYVQKPHSKQIRTRDLQFTRLMFNYLAMGIFNQIYQYKQFNLTFKLPS